MKVYVGVTDQRWYEFLRDRHADEVNFWGPSGRGFGAIRPGEPFLFKTRIPHHSLVGGGVFVGFVQLPLSVAWEHFGEANGVASLTDFRASIQRNRHTAVTPGDDPVIGCRMLRDVSFWPPELVRPAPADWARNLVTGRTYSLDDISGSPVEAAVETLIERAPSPVPRDEILGPVDLGPTRGGARLVQVRLGQGSFRAAIDRAYAGHCAITGNHVRPVLQAAHIRPVEKDGIHRVDNGLLLRADVHLMFDKGYLGVHPERRTLEVSPRLRSEFGNGDEFYARAGTPIAAPELAHDAPSREYLGWHMDEVFRS